MAAKGEHLGPEYTKGIIWMRFVRWKAIKEEVVGKEATRKLGGGAQTRCSSFSERKCGPAAAPR